MASIKQQPDGKWRYRVRYKENGKFRETSKTGFRTKRDAQLAANDIEAKYHKGVQLGSSNQTVQTFLDEWLIVYKKPNVKNSTYMRVERAIRLHILPHFGGMKLKELKKSDMAKWIATLSETQKPGTVRSNVTVFHDALNTATYDLNYLERNPLDRVKLPKEEILDKQIKYYTKEELNQFLHYMKHFKPGKYSHSIQYYVLFTLLARTGIRLGEALALTWGDISENKLNINKTISYDNNNNYGITSPKTESSIREIKLDPITLNLLKRLRINKNECILRYKTFEAPKVKDIIFSSDNGNYMRHSVVREFFYKACAGSEVPVLSPHALRHSHAVHLLEAGANIKYVSSRLGHSSIKMTGDIYLHITEKIEDDALDLYEKYM